MIMLKEDFQVSHVHVKHLGPYKVPQSQVFSVKHSIIYEGLRNCSQRLLKRSFSLHLALPG